MVIAAVRLLIIKTVERRGRYDKNRRNADDTQAGTA